MHGGQNKQKTSLRFIFKDKDTNSGFAGAGESGHTPCGSEWECKHVDMLQFLTGNDHTVNSAEVG